MYVFEIRREKIFLKGRSDFNTNSRPIELLFKNKVGLKKFLVFLRNIGNKEKNLRFSYRERLTLNDFNVKFIR